MIIVDGLQITLLNDKKHGPCLYVSVDGRLKFLCYFTGKDTSVKEIKHQAYCAMYYKY